MDGTIWPATSSRESASSALERRSDSPPWSRTRPRGGSGSGTKAFTWSPPTDVVSYRPGVRFDIDRPW